MPLQDGMFVTFSEVQGMAELNDGKPRKVQNVKVGALLQALELMLQGPACRNMVCQLGSGDPAEGLMRLCMQLSGLHDVDFHHHIVRMDAHIEVL